MSIEELYILFKKHTVITTDSRDVPVGSIFFALKGENFDGNNFALKAIEKGAAYAIADNSDLENKDPRVVIFNDALLALQQLANHHRKRLNKTKIIALTGTNGKTTTKELIFSVLKQKYSITATTGNLNNHIGVPLTLLKIKYQDDFGIVEMGANHPHEIEKLCKIAEPDFGLITNIGMAHLDGFGSFEGVIKAKSELYEYINSTKGLLFYNHEDELLTSIIHKYNCKKISYGSSISNDFIGRLLDANPYLHFTFIDGHKIKNKNAQKEVDINTNTIGDYNFNNFLAAACIGSYFGVGTDSIKIAFEAYIPSQNRSQMIKTKKGNTIILDAYNANPSSMQSALMNFIEYQSDNNKIVLLGEMLELGKYSYESHVSVIELLIRNGLQAILIGKEFKRPSAETDFDWYKDVEELMKALKKIDINNTTLLIKGSRGNKLERIIEVL